VTDLPVHIICALRLNQRVIYAKQSQAAPSGTDGVGMRAVAGRVKTSGETGMLGGHQAGGPLTQRPVRVICRHGKAKLFCRHAHLVHLGLERPHSVIVRLAHSRKLVLEVADGLVLAIQDVLGKRERSVCVC